MKWTLCALALLAVWLLCACAKGPEETAVEAAPPTKASQTVAAGSSGAATDANQLAVTLAELTQVVRKYGAEKQRVPKDLNELVAAGYLPGIPAAPAGKGFAINKQMEVYLAE